MSLVRTLPKQKSYGFGVKKRESKTQSNQSNAMTIPEAIQIIKEKLIFDSRSTWNNSELLYYIPILKRIVNINTPVNETSNINKTNPKLRFLIILKKNEFKSYNVNSGIFFLLQVAVKDNGLFNRMVETKNSWDLRKIRGIDTGSGLTDDIIISVDKGDMIYTFLNSLERDETVWVISQLCKLVASSNTDIIDTFAIGYSVDMEAISYTIVTNGTLNRFPTLYKLFTSNGLLNSDAFGEEEAEAESLLDDLKWTTELASPMDLQTTLSQQSMSLNMQIIDYLLQWEELDDSSSMKGSIPSSLSSSAAGNKSVTLRNTVEILEALNHVDSELEESSLWLSIQIERLSETKSHLVVIEDESGGLESSYQNLQMIRDLIKSIISHLTIDKSNESILLNPEPIISMSLKASTLSNTEELVRPLLIAATNLYEALSYKGEENIFSPSIWKQIRSMNAITEQKNKLYKLAEAFARAATDSLCTVFPMVLKHKSLNDDTKGGQTIDVKAFKTSAVLLHRKRERKKQFETANSVMINNDDSNTQSVSNLLYYVPLELNVLLSCQRLYEEALADYMPLIEKVIQISPVSTSEICKAYIETTHEKLYAPLFKSMMREFRTLMPSSRSPLTLASIQRYQYKGMKEVTVRFSTREALGQENSIQLMPPWELFGMFLLVVTPVVLREEQFFQVLFNIDSNLNENQARDWLSVFMDSNVTTVPILTETNSHIATLFQTLIHLVHKLSAYSSSDIVTRASTINTGTAIQVSTPVDADVDVVETVGLLSVLYQFVYHYLDNIDTEIKPPQTMTQNITQNVTQNTDGKRSEGSNASSSSSSNSNNNSNTQAIAMLSASLSMPMVETTYFDVTSSLVMLMYEIRGIFITRLNAFQRDQIKWIQSAKWDIKRPGVSLPFSKYVSLAYQVLEMACGQIIDHVDNMMGALAKELLDWINTIAQQNPKHEDVFKLQNLIFFEESFNELSQYFPSVKTIISDTVINQRIEAESRYVLWMISYEFGNIGKFANRIEKLGSNVTDDEIALYISSKDILAILKEFDGKRLDGTVLNIRKRLKKHCENAEDSELQIVSKIWTKLKAKTIDIIQKFDAVAASYKITFDVTSKQITQAFDKYANK